MTESLMEANGSGRSGKWNFLVNRAELQMNTYYRMTAPEDLTILERLEWESWAADTRQAELDKTLAHYKAQLRQAEVQKFFVEFDDVNSDPSYLAEREHELGITILEWTAYREAKAQEVF